MNIKKISAFFLAMILLFLVGCGDSSDTSPSTNLPTDTITATPPAESVKLLYSSKDTIDPYTCVTEQNAVLCQFIYEPLLILNNCYEIEYRLAESVETVDNLCTVKLRKANFSDGSPVTAEDVVFSFNKAKASKTTRHAAALKYTTSATVKDIYTVEFHLTRKDAYFSNLLTFPIMKKDSDQLKDSDNRALPPIAAGRYIFDVESRTLTQNKKYYGKHCNIKTILTVDCPDNESVLQSVTAGMIDMYFTDLSDDVIPKMNGTAADISQTRLVFLGINPKNPQLSNSLFRQAISAAINRTEIANESYHSKATPALGPVPSNWKPAEGLLSIQSVANYKTAADNIILAGYENKDKNGFFTLKNKKPITFTLLVNSSNEYRTAAAHKIAESTAKAGIKLNVKAVTDSQYRSMLNSGSYDLYLGEIRYEENMDINGLVNLDSAKKLMGSTTSDRAQNSSSKKGVTSTNTSSTSPSASSLTTSSTEALITPGEITLTTADAYKGFYNGEYTLSDLITAFIAELPVIPICFKSGLIIYSNDFGSGITPSRTELFHGIQ